MIRLFFFLLLLLLLGTVLQQWLPSFGMQWYHSRILVVPLLFFCFANLTDYSSTLFFAVLAGCLWDAENSLAPFVEVEGVTIDKAENLKFGYSVALFGLLGFIVKFLQAKLPFYGLLVSVSFVFCSLVLYLLLENLLIIFVRGTLHASPLVFYQILLTAGLSAFLSPIVFYSVLSAVRILKLRRSPAMKLRTLLALKKRA